MPKWFARITAPKDPNYGKTGLVLSAGQGRIVVRIDDTPQAYTPDEVEIDQDKEQQHGTDKK